MKVVVVESPSKAKTLNKYLGSDYKVLASYGHVRDLPSKDGSVNPEDNFSMNWEVSKGSDKHIKDIATATKGADALYLATDPDREGEAISWHVKELLEKKKLLKGIEVKRIVFNEVTKRAVLEAFDHPRELDEDLVQAYLARRALDYLVGFSVSPVLWRKLPGSRSAGRVQSVALRLVTVRESEIEAFNPQEYWTIEANFLTPSDKPFKAQLTHLNGKKLKKFDLGIEAAAKEAVQQINKFDTYTVSKVEKKQVQRNPSAPFTTSTLQQEASRKLGFGASMTMRTAQKLYEGMDLQGETVGLITYMRTDSVQMASEAIQSCRSVIEQTYGKNYVSPSQRVYKTKAKNAQEAHEAIRPTDLSRTPEQLKSYLDASQLKLYTLVWRRAISSQMASAVVDQVGVDMVASDQSVQFRTTGSTITFDGFLKVYEEGKDDSEASDDEKNRKLPPLHEKDTLQKKEVSPLQHFTQPPPRYSEASLVKKLEELGIGRPSTYASIISVLQDRGYVRLEKKRFFPEDRGRIVTTFLENFFERYVQYSFTADLEDQLDEISGGRLDWKKVLDEFWIKLKENIETASELRITQVIEILNEALATLLFPPRADGKDPKKCPDCNEGDLSLKLGKFGAFIGCSNYPECRFTRRLKQSGEKEETEEEIQASSDFPKELGIDPTTKLAITIRKGPYGLYLQLGEPEGKSKPKRAPIPRGYKAETLNLTDATSLLSLPRDVGIHPDSGEPITAGIGRFGPYLKYENKFVSLPKDDDVLTVDVERAVVVIAEAKEKAKTKGKKGFKKKA